MTDRRFWAEEEVVVLPPGGQEAGEPVPEAAAEAARAEYPTYVEQLRAELAEKDRQLREYIAAYKEAVGKGLEEVKTRLQRESAREVERTRGRLVEDLLEVADNLERSLAAAARASGDAAPSALLEGVRHVHAMFLAKLAKLGLVRIDVAGATFDPRLHEAIGVTQVPPEQDGKVMAEARAGYRFGEQVLRPAQVLVGRKVPETTSPDGIGES